LVVRSATAEAKAVDLVPLQVDFAAGEPMRPEWIQGKAMAQKFDRPRLVGATEVDDSTAWLALQIERPLRWERATRGMVFGMEKTIQTRGVSLGKAMGNRAEGLQSFMMKPLPDLSLAEAVEVFDGGLEAAFQWRSKNRCDAEGKTEAHDSSDDIGMVVPALETDVVIKLGEGWQSMFAPK
jgi:hypothetical protein